MTDMDVSAQKYFSTSDAAAYCGLSPRQMGYRVKSGKIKPAKLAESSQQHHLNVFSRAQLDDMKARGFTDVEPPDMVDSNYIMGALGLEKSTVYYHVVEGNIPSYKIGHYNVYEKETADRFIEERRAG